MCAFVRKRTYYNNKKKINQTMTMYFLVCQGQPGLCQVAIERPIDRWMNDTLVSHQPASSTPNEIMFQGRRIQLSLTGNSHWVLDQYQISASFISRWHYHPARSVSILIFLVSHLAMMPAIVWSIVFALNALTWQRLHHAHGNKRWCLSTVNGSIELGCNSYLSE